MIYIDIRKAGDYGIGTYVKNLVPLVLQHLSEFGLGGEIRLLANAWQDLSFVPGLFLIHVVEMKSAPFTFYEQLEFRQIIRSSDIFWATSLSHPLWHCNLLSTVHDLLQLDLPIPTVSSLMRRSIFWLYFKSLAVKSLAIVFNSHFTANRFSSHFPGCHAPSIVAHLGPGISAARSPSIDEKSDYFVMIGNNRPHKNIDFVLNQFCLMPEFASYTLKVIGFNNLEFNNFSPCSYGCNIVFLGYIGASDLVLQLQQAKALIFPSLYEGFGLPAIEAMSCGCPVVASSNSALPEVCGPSAFYFDPTSSSSLRSALRTCVDLDLKSYSEVVRASRLHASKFNWSDCAELTISFIRNTLHV